VPNSQTKVVARGSSPTAILGIGHPIGLLTVLDLSAGGTRYAMACSPTRTFVSPPFQPSFPVPGTIAHMQEAFGGLPGPGGSDLAGSMFPATFPFQVLSHPDELPG